LIESARRRTDTQTDRHADANRFYNLSHAICYSYGTDNYLLCQSYDVIHNVNTNLHSHRRLWAELVSRS